MKAICSAFICICDETLMGCSRYEIIRSADIDDDDDDDDDVSVNTVDMASDASIVLLYMTAA